MPFYKYARPALTVDVILVSGEGDDQRVLMIQRKNDPFKNLWAFPGGFVDENEDLLTAACRELQEETTVSDVALSQFCTVGTPGRDPRGHTVSVVYLGCVDAGGISVEAQDDAKDVRWFPLNALPALAFDHERILEEAKAYLDKA
jgi:8-oxo-dGTP diphosphatase